MRLLLTHRLAVPFLLLAGSVGPLAVALLVQHVGHLPPCHFCLLQRWPYVFVALCGLGALIAPHYSPAQRSFTALALLGWLATGLLAFIHHGIERHWLAYQGGCVATPAADSSLEALRAQIMGAPIVACNEVSASFLGLSMAGWNMLAAFLLIPLTVWLYRRQRRVVL